MSFEIALRLTEIGLSIALLQRGAEHVVRDGWTLFVPQILLAGFVLVGLFPAPALAGLWVCLILQLLRFEGPYNGGSDKMIFLALTCVLGCHLAPSQLWADMALAYLAVQLTLSYFVSGAIKLVNPSWRSGEALRSVFVVSVYPVSQQVRGVGQNRVLVLSGSWIVILFETLFPLALLHPVALKIALALAGFFHLANAVLFGLNRFLWAWIAVYPTLVWLQGRLQVL